MEFWEAIDLEVEILFIGQVYNCHIALQSFTLSSPGPTYALGTTSLPQRGPCGGARLQDTPGVAWGQFKGRGQSCTLAGAVLGAAGPREGWLGSVAKGRDKNQDESGSFNHIAPFVSRGTKDFTCPHLHFLIC